MTSSCAYTICVQGVYFLATVEAQAGERGAQAYRPNASMGDFAPAGSTYRTS